MTRHHIGPQELIIKVYWNDPNAPLPNRPLQPGTCAVIMNEKDEVFLHRRADNPLWALPGGVMEVGESVADSCIREVKEETGMVAQITRLIGLYTSPRCIVAFDDGTIFQSFVVAFLCRVTDVNVTLNRESHESGWFTRDAVEKLVALPFVQEIITDAFEKGETAFD